jgi:hypothetical protein
MRFSVALSRDVPWRVIGRSPSTWPKFGARCIVRGRGAMRFTFCLFSGADGDGAVLDGGLAWEPFPGRAGFHAVAEGDEYMVVTKKRLFKGLDMKGEGNEGDVQDS